MNQLISRKALASARPLAGEVIAPGDSVTVVAALNIFETAPQTVSVPAGSTLAECVEAAEVAYDGTPPQHVVVKLGDTVVEPEWWGRVRIKPGAYVAVHGVPGGGRDFIRNILFLVVAVAALAASVFLGPVIGTFAASLIALGIGVGGSLLVNALFPVRPPVLGADRRSGAGASPTYSISGGSNTADPFGPIPFYLGKHRAFPKLAARPYTEFVSNEQYLHMLFCWGYGRIDISDLRIGETELSQFQDVQVQHNLAYTGGNMSLFPTEVIEDQLSIDLKVNEENIRTTADAVTRIAVDFVAPQGLWKVDSNNGSRDSINWRISIQYRAVGTTAWKSFANQIDYTNVRTPKAQRQTRIENVSAGQYQVKVVKTSGNDDDKDRFDQTFWTALRGYRSDQPVEMPGKTLALTALRIKATGQLSGVVSALNAVVDNRQIGWVPGISQWVVNRLTQNPADHFRAVLQGQFNARPVPDAKIDLTRLQAWWVYCNSRGYKFNMVRDFRASVWECLGDICSAGRAFPVFLDGKWSVVFDDQTASVVGHFTPRNSRDFKEERSYLRVPHAFRVRFTNEEKGYKEDERIVYDDGFSASNASLFEEIQFPGITHSDLAWKFGRFHIAQARLRPSSYSLLVAREHFRNTVGDRVRVQHYLPLWGLVSGRVTSIDGETISLDEPVTMQDGKSYSIRFTEPGTGTSFTRTVLNEPGLTTELNLGDTGSLPDEGYLFSFGETGLETVILRIKKIEPVDEAEARLLLLDDAPEIDQADTGEIPAFNSRITAPTDARTLNPRNVTAHEYVPVAGEAETTAALVSWELPTFSLPSSPIPALNEPSGTLVPTGAEVGFRQQGGDEWDTHGFVAVPNLSAIVGELDEGIYSFRVRAFFSNGLVSDWTQVDGIPIVGQAQPPSDVEGLTAAVNTDFIRLSWNAITTRGFSHYVVRFAPVLFGAEWSAAQIIAAKVETTSILLPTLIGTYLVKGVNILGVESANAAQLASNVAGLRGLNAIQLLQEHPDFGQSDSPPAELINTEVVSGVLRLIAVGGVLEWPEILSITAGHWTTQFPLEGTYYPGWFDLGEVFTSRVTVNLSVNGANINDDNFIGAWGALGDLGFIGGIDASGWEVRYEERHTVDDPAQASPGPEWTEWAEIQAAQDYTFRAIDRRLVLRSTEIDVRPLVSEASIVIDMPDTFRSEDDVLIASDGMRVSFDPPFRIYAGTGISHRVLDDEVRILISNEDETGFDVTAKDAVDAFVSSQRFSYVARGAGSRQTA